MSDPTAQEPTMEEILASIRRIISEDDAPAAEPAVAHAVHAVAEAEHHPEPAPAVAAAPAPAPVHLAAVAHVEEEEDDVLELTEPAPKPKETHGDLDVFDADPPHEPVKHEPIKHEPVKAARHAHEPIKPAPVIEEEPFHTPSFSMDEERLISGGTEDKAFTHFGKLSQSIAMPAAGRNLEDVVAELLKPLLKDWLDEHLPSIVEEKVQAEVERIARRRV